MRRGLAASVSLRSLRRGVAAVVVAVLASTPAQAFVDDPDTIDALKVHPGGGVVMIVVQDRPWSGETHVMLGEKLGGYARYALGGQLLRDNPEAAGQPIRIVVVSEAQPGADDGTVLAAFREQLRPLGLDLAWGGIDALPALAGAQ